MPFALFDRPLICSQGGIPINKAHLDAKDAEIERLRAERDALFSENGKLANTIGAENLRLRQIVTAPLSPAEQRLIDKHCDWVAFGHAWNAVMKRRRDAVNHEQELNEPK